MQLNSKWTKWLESQIVFVFEVIVVNGGEVARLL